MLAVCPGSFDPITNGHLDVITRAASIFDEVLVAVGQNSTKQYLFSQDERVELVRASTAHLPNVRVEQLHGLLANYVNDVGGRVLIKGVRFAADFEFELQMANLNAVVGAVETLILPAASQWSTLSSSMVREIAVHGGDVSAFVPDVVAAKIRLRAGEERADG
ncbi:MAG: pantetheine-phosphate adenylyltransferase [Actinobacteria bacterium HGW-Actinobacteria-2]|nr:MAG: pantetheine-phosphate adenylyltransferase [Actinobacteria bacterium HGW-Actinobacteria-2]